MGEDLAHGSRIGRRRFSSSLPIVGRKMQTVGNAPAATMRSMPRIGGLDRLEAGDDFAGDAASSQLLDAYSIASKNPSWPTVAAFPGQMRSNQDGSSNS